VIVDDDVKVFPAGASHPVASVPSGPVSDGLYSPKLLDVKVKEFSRVCSLIAHDGLRWLHPIEPVKSVATQDPADRRL